MKVMVAICNGGSVKSQTMTDTIAALFANLHAYTFMLADATTSMSTHSRWLAAKQAIEHGCDYLWFIDSDMAFPADALPRLLAHGKDIVGAAYHYSRMPLLSTVKVRDSNGNLDFIRTLPTELFEVGALGAGCLLITVEALKRIPQPWFAMSWDRETGELNQTEDTWFCLQAQAVGIPVYCDPTLDVKHIGDFLH